MLLLLSILVYLHQGFFFDDNVLIVGYEFIQGFLFDDNVLIVGLDINYGQQF